MLCDRILGNIADAGRTWGAPDTVEVSWDECSKRALRKRSRSGRELKILLPLGVRIRHGDVLIADGRGCIVVEVPLCEVLVVKPANLQEMGLLALELGNLHVPVEVAGNSLIVLPFGPVEALLARYGIAHERASRRFAPLPVEVAPPLRLAADFRVARA